MEQRQPTDASSAEDLVVEWRLDASRMEKRGVVDAARIIRSMADQLETVLQHEGLEILTLRQASAESGYSADHLRRIGQRWRCGERRTSGRPADPAERSPSQNRWIDPRRPGIHVGTIEGGDRAIHR